MADEWSPGEIIDDVKIVSKLMERLWECECRGKGARLTPESVRYASAAIRHYHLELTRRQPFQNMHYHIEEFKLDAYPRVILRSESLTMAHAAFDAGKAEFPRSYLIMGHRARLVRDSRLEQRPPTRASI